MNNGPIGVFDSGLGGLTAVKELRRILPGEDIIYFGDIGRVPYGNRGRDTIISYTKQDIAFLLSQKVKTLVAACGTVSSTFPPEEGAKLPVFYTGVVQAAALAAVKATKSGRIGIIGTEVTIASGSYQAALRDISPQIYSVGNACPLFVPLVENGHFGKNDPMAALAAEEYLKPIQKADVDTLILGCTHYPLLAETLANQMGPQVTLIDPGKETALHLRDYLTETEFLNNKKTGGKVEYFVSDDPTRFNHLAQLFLGSNDGSRAERISIEEYQLAQHI